MTYQAPLADMTLALAAQPSWRRLQQAGVFEDLSEAFVEQILSEAGRFCADVIAPLQRVGDANPAHLENGVVRTSPGYKDAYAQLVEAGWQSLPFPPEHGGMGLPRVLATAVIEMIQSADMAFGLAPMLSLGAVEALIAHGTEAQQAAYLPKLVTGEWTGTMNLTEPQAGSDLAGLKTKAIPDGEGGYRLFGQKIYITWGEHDCADNIVHLVLARLPDAPEGTRGISLFLAPKFLVNADGGLGARNDLRAIGLEHKLGIHGSPTCTMAFGEAEGAVAELIGEPHRGLAAMFTMMNSARLNVGAQGVGVAERAYQKALAYAMERRQGRAPGVDAPAPHPIAHHPDIGRLLMVARAKILAGRAICFAQALAADLAHHGLDETAAAREALLTPIAKAWGTDMGCEVTSSTLQVHGGMGFVEETGAAQYYRDVRIAPIYEGTNGIQAMDLVGRKVAADEGRAMAALLGEIRDHAKALAEGPLSDLAPALERGLGALAEATAYMVQAEPRDRLAGATPYLSLAGDVIGAHLLLAEAETAADVEHAGAGARAALARVFAQAVLSLAPGKAQDAMAGVEALDAATQAALDAA
ncbi:MAG: acyl-CoA dehydrogenase [Maricaulaceae bacterium]